MQNDPIIHIFMALYFIGGTCVLATYWYMYTKYEKYDELQRIKVWSVLDANIFNKVWYITSTLSTLAFFLFSIDVMSHLKGNLSKSTTDDPSWLLYAYTSFLIGSALYVPLLLNAHKAIVMLDLLIVSISTIALEIWCIQFWNFTDSVSHGACFILMAILALHCTIFDLVIWGIGWYNGYVVLIKEELDFQEFVAKRNERWVCDLLSVIDHYNSQHNLKSGRLSREKLSQLCKSKTLLDVKDFQSIEDMIAGAAQKKQELVLPPNLITP